MRVESKLSAIRRLPLWYIGDIERLLSTPHHDI